MKKYLLVLFLSAIALAGKAQAPRVIAHRGYWDCAGSAQNSLTSLAKAAEAGVYGSEFDMQLTQDGVLVVNHDDDIQGHLIADTPFAELSALTLSNGEPLPTLRTYLETGSALNVQLILEIKPLGSAEKEDEAVRKTVAMVRELGLEERVEYISFSLNACERLAEATPGSAIAYLTGDMEPGELQAKGINGIDYPVRAFTQRPDWVKAAHELGMKVNVWTVNKDEQIRAMIALGVDYITTDRPLDAKAMVVGQE